MQIEISVFGQYSSDFNCNQPWGVDPPQFVGSHFERELTKCHNNSFEQSAYLKLILMDFLQRTFSNSNSHWMSLSDSNEGVSSLIF